MDQLERRVEKLVTENNNFRQKVKVLSDENGNLLKELQQLLFTSFPKNQSLVISRNTKRLLRADKDEMIESNLEWNSPLSLLTSWALRAFQMENENSFKFPLHFLLYFYFWLTWTYNYPLYFAYMMLWS